MKKQKSSKKGLVILCVVLAVAIAVIAAAAILPGVIRRRQPAAKTAHFKVTAPMYSYFFYDSVEKQLTGGYKQVYEYYGITADTDLRTVKYSEEQSWFDFMEEATAKRLQTMLSYAESAIDAGFTLDPTAGDETVADLRAKAAASGKGEGYLASRYGKGVSYEDIAKMEQIRALADARSTQLAGEIVVTDGQIAAYAAEHEEKLLRADLCFYVLEPTEAISDKTALREKADQLASCNTLALYSAWVRAYENELAAASGGAPLTDDEWEEVYHDFYYEKLDYEATTQIDPNYRDRAPGETLVSVDEKTGSCGVLLALSPLARDETPGFNLQIASFTEENAASLALEALSETTPTAEVFATACEARGGAVTPLENAPAEGAGLPAALSEWLLSRPEQGALYAFAEQKVSYLVRFGGEGYCGWQKTAFAALRQEAYGVLEEKLLQDYAGKVTLAADTAAKIAERK